MSGNIILLEEENTTNSLNELKNLSFSGENIAIRVVEKSMKINREFHCDTLVGSIRCVV